jgi:hypothetical protein
MLFGDIFLVIRDEKFSSRINRILVVKCKINNMIEYWIFRFVPSIFLNCSLSLICVMKFFRLIRKSMSLMFGLSFVGF